MSMFSDDITLGEVREWLQDNADDGVTCPCCEQFAKVYRRSLPLATAMVMLTLWRDYDGGRNYVYLPDVLDTVRSRTAQQGGYGTYGHHWGLMQQMDGVRDDGSNRVGWWKLTNRGRGFVNNVITVHQYAHIYNNKCLGFSGEQWTIRDALRNRFDYDDMMNGI